MPHKLPEARAAYARAYAARADRKPIERARTRAYLKRKRAANPHEASFVAIDSEGFSYGDSTPLEDGKRFRPHGTFLWGAGDQEGATDWLESSGRLSSLAICDWLLSLPRLFPKSIFVSFSFSYDAAQILADLPYEKLWEIQRGYPFDGAPSKGVGGNRRITFWRDFGFQYLKGKRFQLYRFRPGADPYIVTKSGKLKLNSISKILIYDVFGFFQSSFLKACKSMPGAVKPDEYETLFSGKGNRANFQPSDIAAVKPYTATELRVLARMMSILRGSMINEGIFVRQWFGAGSIAQALLKRENVKAHFWPVVTRELPDYQRWAHHAYFGGRIELLRQGFTPRRLHGYDIASAYPAVASQLPSMRDGEWVHRVNPTRSEIERMSALSMIEIRTHGFPDASFYPLPYRTPKGSILFPREVYGYYMRDEVSAAFAWGATFGLSDDCVECISAWEFIVRDATLPFAFLQKLFDYRTTLAKEDVTQIVVKLGINSCYGKLAQAVASGTTGKPPSFANPWYAAAITSGARARLLLAALSSPKDIVMLATDGIISTVPLPLDCPKQKTLGAWESGELKAGGVFVQSGVYCISDERGDFHSKTRGFRPLHLGALSVADMLRQNVPALWAQDRASLDFSYQSYMTLGASVASRALCEHIGRWVDGTRQLDLRGAGIKRDVDPSPKLRRSRAKKLLATSPSSQNMLLVDSNGNLPISAEFTPDWLDREFGEATAIDDDVAAIFQGRFE